MCTEGAETPYPSASDDEVGGSSARDAPAAQENRGQGRNRTGDLSLFRRTLLPTELPGLVIGDRFITAYATPTGLEPATSAVTGRRANQLRHRALLSCVLRVSALRTPNGIRTRATAVKGRRPRPLDDGGRITPASNGQPLGARQL